MASFNPSIPIVSDFMLQSQPQIKANFQAISTAFAQNHKSLNNTDQGMHNVITFREQTVDPTTAANQVSLYTKSVSSAATLFYRPSSNQTPIQLTYPSISTGLQSTSPDVYFPEQYSFVAGPFVVYMGLLKNVTDGQAVNLLPVTNLIYVGLTTANAAFNIGNTAMIPTSIAGNQFIISTALSLFVPRDAYYIAIGK